MKQRLSVAVLVLLAILLPLALTGAAQKEVKSGARDTSSSPEDFLKVGQTYVFERGGQTVGKVLAKPSGNWVKVEVRVEGQSITYLLNLHHITAIAEYTPLEKKK